MSNVVAVARDDAPGMNKHDLLADENTTLSAEEIVTKSLSIAGDICVFTNHNQTIETLA